MTKIIKDLNSINIDSEEDNTSPYHVVLTYLLEEVFINRNEITMQFEIDGHEQSEQDLNRLFVDLKLARPKLSGLTNECFFTILNSSLIPSFNPILKAFAQLPPAHGEEQIVHLFNALLIVPIPELEKEKYRQGIEGSVTEEVLYIMFRKWLIGIVASAFDKNYNSLMLVLIGPKNCGKTEFFRHLLPPKLQPYFAQSKFNQEKDSEALMCEKLLILNDELDGFHSKEAKAFRNFISSNQYTYRPPYGRKNITRKRLATVGGTANDRTIISEGEHNRRIIPIEITKVLYEEANKIDREKLFAEIYQLYKDGEKWDLNNGDIVWLEAISEKHEQMTAEFELIQEYFSPNDGTMFMTATEIKVSLDSQTRQRLSPVRIGQALNRLGFERKSTRVNGAPKYVYTVRPLKSFSI